jgi:hypothetical protein
MEKWVNVQLDRGMDGEMDKQKKQIMDGNSEGQKDSEAMDEWAHQTDRETVRHTDY